MYNYVFKINTCFCFIIHIYVIIMCIKKFKCLLFLVNNFPIFKQFFNHIFRKMICLFNLKMRKLAVSKILQQTESLVIH